MVYRSVDHSSPVRGRSDLDGELAGDDVPDREAEGGDAAHGVGAEPAAEPVGERRHDHLVERHLPAEDVDDGGDRARVTDLAGDVDAVGVEAADDGGEPLLGL